MKSFTGLYTQEPQPAQSLDKRYKLKWALEAVSINNKLGMEQLLKEVDTINSDPTKNEKVCVIFRAFDEIDGIQTLIDKGQKIDYNSLPPPISAPNLLKKIQEYAQYIKLNFSTTAKPEIVYGYYPLDTSIESEEISEEDKMVERVSFFLVTGSQTIRKAIQTENQNVIDKKLEIHKKNKLIKSVNFEKERLSQSIQGIDSLSFIPKTNKL